MTASPPTPSNELRGSKLAVTGLLFLLLLIAGLGLKPGHNQTILETSLQTWGHFVFFGALAICSALASPYLIPWLRSRRCAQYAVGLLVSILAGGLLEFAQKFIPARYASFEDLIFDIAGAVGAIGLLAFIQHRGRGGFRWKTIQLSGAILFVATLIYGSIPFVTCLRDYWQRKSAVPVLLDFREPWSWRFMFVDDGATIGFANPPREWSGSDNVALLRIRPGYRYPGLGMREPHPDWRAYKALAFDVYSTSDEAFQIRIQDRQHNDDYYDRFNRALPIVKGFQTIRIPTEAIRDGPRHRQLDLAHIGGFELFTIEPQQEIQFYIGNVRLE